MQNCVLIGWMSLHKKHSVLKCIKMSIGIMGKSQVLIE